MEITSTIFFFLVRIKFTLTTKCFLPVADNCWHLCNGDSRPEIKKELFSFFTSLSRRLTKPDKQTGVHTKQKAEQVRMEILITYGNNT